MSIILQSSGGGQVTVQEPTTASNFTITLPATTGTMALTSVVPAFRAFKSASTQTPTSGVTTKVTFDAETFDTNNNFASSTFTPTVAGYYQINAVVDCGSNAITKAIAFIYKNGSVYGLAGSYIIPAASEIGPCIADIVYCNGTTDYIEIYTQITGSTVIIYNGSPYTYFSGALIRAA